MRNSIRGDELSRRLYYKWFSMNRRCNNPNDAAYRNYGGRGIQVCTRWKDFRNFEVDMRESYEEHLAEHGVRDTTIDRINNDLGYSKENCNWATRSEQARNTRRYKKRKMKNPRETRGTNNPRCKTQIELLNVSGRERMVVVEKSTGNVLKII